MDLGQARRLAEMAVDMAEQPDLAHTLDRILADARLTVPCDAVGVQLVSEGGRIGTAALSHELRGQAAVVEVDAKGQAGPCLDHLETLDSLVINDTSRDQRWPMWSAHVAELGWMAVLSLRLYTPSRTLGALNLYSCTEHAFGPEDLEVATLFSRHASIVLVAAQSCESLRSALSGRRVIGQAQGILMERYQMDADRAFTVLQRYSQDRNIKLRVVAERVIGDHQLPV